MAVNENDIPLLKWRIKRAVLVVRCLMNHPIAGSDSAVVEVVLCLGCVVQKR
jgi:hypothetical protein